MHVNYPVFRNYDKYLLLLMGPMGANKSVLSIISVTYYHDTGHKCLFINSNKDTRKTSGGDGSKFTSHNTSNNYINPNIDNVKVSLLSDVDVTNYDVIVIDEGQFYKDLVSTVIDWLDKNKKIIIYGLDGDHKRQKFGFMLDLIPYADSYVKLTSSCSICGGDAPFTYQGDMDELTSRGIKYLHDGYVPVCRKHYDLLDNTI